MLLILANKWDLTVDLVVLELQKRGLKFVRLNTEDLPDWSAMARFPTGRASILSPDHKHVSCDDVSAIWNRRPGHVFDNVVTEERPSPEIQRFMQDQWFAWLDILKIRPDVLWVNHPAANELMESKLRQLQLASDFGFKIPETLITNDVAELLDWRSQIKGQLICKALYSPLIEGESQDHFIFTNALDEIPEDTKSALRLAPVIFQRALMPKVDYRVTVVGNEVFAVRIETSDNALDWRTAGRDTRFTLEQLSPSLEDRCRQYVRLGGLKFGAIDLARVDDDFYFLEINPNGEWGWLQRPHGVPIAQAMCTLLTSADR